MHSYTLAKIWIRKGHCSVVLAALLLVLLSQAVVAATIESPEQASGGSDCASTHTVVSGETLTGLAEGAGVSLSALAQANNLSTTDQVLIGQELVYPSHHKCGFNIDALLINCCADDRNCRRLDWFLLQHTRPQRRCGFDETGWGYRLRLGVRQPGHQHIRGQFQRILDRHQHF